MRCSLFTAVVRSAAVFVFYSTASSAQVEVVESSPSITTPFGLPANAAPAQAQPNVQEELYFQLQTLQQEVAQLRGLVEEQAYELKRLKQQRTDDYVDLDRRISELAGGGVSPRPGSSTAVAGGSAPAPSSDNPVTQTNTPRGAPTADEMASYNAAMDLIRSKQYDQAISGFKGYLEKFPSGQYAANSYHWLGQLYQLRNKPTDAKAAYQSVVDNYPSHNKASDAKLKLGQLLFQSGDKTKAKSLLEEVAASGSDEARLARNFLQENFK